MLHVNTPFNKVMVYFYQQFCKNENGIFDL